MLRVQIIGLLIFYFWGIDIAILYMLNAVLINSTSKSFEEEKLFFISFFVNGRK